VRLHIQSTWKESLWYPESFARYFDLCNEHRAWTLMNKPDGSFFTSWSEFCQHEKPWGLGANVEDVTKVLELAHGKRAVALVTVDPPRSPPGKKTDTVSGISDGEARKAGRHRAILRAGEDVLGLYRENLMGQEESAMCGPKPRKDESSDEAGERAAKIAHAVHEAKSIAQAADPKTKKEKREVAKKINAHIRSTLSKKTERSRDDPAPIAKAIESFPYERLAELVAMLSHERRRALFVCLKDAS
jgi:hypothetical protein